MSIPYDISLSSDAFRRLIFTLATDLVWKNTGLANSYEPNCDLYETELFIAANRGLLNFDIVKSFPIPVLLNCGFSQDDAEAYHGNKSAIPVDMRPMVVREYQTALSSKHPLTGRYAYNVPYKNENGEWRDNYVQLYVEKNDYYRMLMGLPNIDDTEFIYNTKRITWPMDIPIHEMELSDRLEMEEAGYLDELAQLYPDKKYIRYLGKRGIDFFTSRTADRYDVLWLNTYDVPSNMVEEFIIAYERNKNVVNKVYYTDAFSKANDCYDGFLAMCILFMTLQVMNSRYLEKDITRDFYDTESLKAVYDSYGVPFYSEIPLEYHKRIVKHINKLIGYKGSNQVFLDLFDIFDLGSMNIYSYYLVKSHRLDPDGNPLFIYTTDEEGNRVLAEDQTAAYDIKFAKSLLGEDPALQIADTSNLINYEEIVSVDPYWVMDEDLQNKLNSESYNYNETKYIGIQSVFDLMKLTYENSYAIKMIYDNRHATDFIKMTISGGTIEASLFDFFIYLGALYCKSKGWEGVISPEGATVATYLGYDFKQSLETLMNKSYYTSHIATDPELINLLRNMDITNIASVNTVLEKILDLREYLANLMMEAKNPDEFHIYRDLYQTLLVSEHIEGVFGLYKDSENSTSYQEVLAKESPLLYARYMEVTDYATEIENVVASIEQVIPAMENLSFAADLDTNTLIESLFKILQFFKSAEAELVGYDMIYLLTMRGVTFMKYLDEFVSITETLAPFENDLELIDAINHIYDHYQKIKSYCVILDDNMVPSYIKRIVEEHIHYLTDRTKSLIVTYTDFSHDMELIDVLSQPEIMQGKPFRDNFHRYLKDSLYQYVNTKSEVVDHMNHVKLSDFFETVLYDVFGGSIIEHIPMSDYITLLESRAEEVVDKAEILIRDMIKSIATIDVYLGSIKYRDEFEFAYQIPTKISSDSILYDKLKPDRTQLHVSSAVIMKDVLYEINQGSTK